MTGNSPSQDERFTIKGHWWLSESTRKVAGEVTYDVGNMTLALYGGLNDARTDPPLSATPELSEFPIIHGESLDRVPITMFGTFYTRWTPDIRGVAIRPGTLVPLLSSELSCNAMILGSYLSSQDETFIKCRIEIPHLDNWLGDSPFQIGMEGSGEHIHIDYTRPNNEEIPVDGCDFSVRFVRTVRPPGYPCYSPSIEHRTDLEIVASKPMPLIWFQQHASEITDLFSFLYGGCVQSRRLALVKSITGDDEVTLYYPRPEVKLVELTTTDIVVRYDKVKESLALVLKNWFTANTITKGARRIVLSSERRPSAFIELRFLPLVHAAELLTQDGKHSTIVDEKVFKAIRAKMLASLSTELSSELTDSIKSSLGWANGRNLKAKLLSILNELQDKTCSLFCMEKVNFIKGIVDTRNYYTHYSEKVKPLQSLALHWAIKKAALMLRILLLLKAGIPERDIQHFVRSNVRLSQDRTVWTKVTEEGSPPDDIDN